MGRVVNATPPASLHPASIVWEARWAPGPVWTSAENLAPTRIRSSDRPVVSELLHQLHYPGPRFLSLAILFSITALCIAYLIPLWLLLISYGYTVLAISGSSSCTLGTKSTKTCCSFLQSFTKSKKTKDSS